ncbi:hypothetical protein D3C80_1513210 [compost metagenome]
MGAWPGHDQDECRPGHPTGRAGIRRRVRAQPQGAQRQPGAGTERPEQPAPVRHRPGTDRPVRRPLAADLPGRDLPVPPLARGIHCYRFTDPGRPGSLERADHAQEHERSQPRVRVVVQLRQQHLAECRSDPGHGHAHAVAPALVQPATTGHQRPGRSQ